MNQQWKEIDFTNGLYSCSSEGLIRSNKSGRILNGTKTPDGYRGIGLVMPDGKQKSFLYHRVVAMVWHPNPDNLGQVDHKDKNRMNNHPDNLEWVSGLENLSRAGKNIGTDVAILVSPEGKEFEVTISYSFAKEMGLNQDGVRGLITGKMNKHKGWTRKE